MPPPLLDFQKHIAADLLQRDGLAVLARGLGVEQVLLQLLLTLDGCPGTLVFLLNVSEKLVKTLNRSLAKIDDGEALVRITEITNTTPETIRHQLYLTGGVFSVTNRILVTDLLKQVIPLDVITGLVVNQADRLTELSTEAFIVRLYREQNKRGFIRALSQRPSVLTKGSFRLDKTLKLLHVDQAYLWPRFHMIVMKELSAAPPDVLEYRQPLGDLTQKCQEAILLVMKQLLQDIQKETRIDIPGMSNMEQILTASSDSSLRAELNSVLNTVPLKARQLIRDLSLLRECLGYLLSYDCVTFYRFLLQVVEQSSQQQSVWIFSPAGTELLRLAKRRIYHLPPKRPSQPSEIAPPTVEGEQQQLVMKQGRRRSGKRLRSPLRLIVEPNSKWDLLQDILESILMEQEGSASSSSSSEAEGGERTRVYIFCRDERICGQLVRLLCLGTEKWLESRWKSYLHSWARTQNEQTLDEAAAAALSEITEGGVGVAEDKDRTVKPEGMDSVKSDIKTETLKQSDSSSSSSSSRKNVRRARPNQIAEFRRRLLQMRTESSSAKKSSAATNPSLIVPSPFEELRRERTFLALAYRSLGKGSFLGGRSSESSSPSSSSSSSSPATAASLKFPLKRRAEETRAKPATIVKPHRRKKRLKTKSSSSDESSPLPPGEEERAGQSSGADELEHQEGKGSSPHDSSETSAEASGRPQQWKSDREKRPRDVLREMEEEWIPEDPLLQELEDLIQLSQQSLKSEQQLSTTPVAVSSSSSSSSSSRQEEENVIHHPPQQGRNSRESTPQNRLSESKQESKPRKELRREERKAETGEAEEEEGAEDPDEAQFRAGRLFLYPVLDPASMAETEKQEADDDGENDDDDDDDDDDEKDPGKISLPQQQLEICVCTRQEAMDILWRAGEGGRGGSRKSLQHIILYDPDLDLVRRVEVYAALRHSSQHHHHHHPPQELKLHFLLYEQSTEEQRYIGDVSREQKAFEKLIAAKSRLAVSEDDPEDEQEEEETIQGKGQWRRQRRRKTGDIPPSEEEEEEAAERLREAQASWSAEHGGRMEGYQRFLLQSSTSSSVRDVSQLRFKAKEQQRRMRNTVIVDIREFRSSLPSILHLKGFRLLPVTLEIGDYLLGPQISVERKSLPDLRQSLMAQSGRLHRQMKRMSRAYQYPMLLIEFEAGSSESSLSSSSSSSPSSSSAFASNTSHPGDPSPPRLQAGGGGFGGFGGLQPQWMIRQMGASGLRADNIIVRLAILCFTFPHMRILWSRNSFATASMFRSLKQIPTAGPEVEERWEAQDWKDFSEQEILQSGDGDDDDDEDRDGEGAGDGEEEEAPASDLLTGAVQERRKSLRRSSSSSSSKKKRKKKKMAEGGKDHGSDDGDDDVRRKSSVERELPYDIAKTMPGVNSSNIGAVLRKGFSIAELISLPSSDLDGILGMTNLQRLDRLLDYRLKDPSMPDLEEKQS